LPFCVFLLLLFPSFLLEKNNENSQHLSLFSYENSLGDRTRHKRPVPERHVDDRDYSAHGCQKDEHRSHLLLRAQTLEQAITDDRKEPKDQDQDGADFDPISGERSQVIREVRGRFAKKQISGKDVNREEPERKDQPSRETVMVEQNGGQEHKQQDADELVEAEQERLHLKISR
jgi:hypothetical protein